MSYRQKVGVAKLAVPGTPRFVGAYDTLIKESRLQNNPDGELEPPRTGRPCTIFPVATLTAFASLETQSCALPAEQFLINPLFPKTKTYGCRETTPPDTDTLLLNVAVTVADAVALLDIVTVVPTTDTTVVYAGIPAPVIA